MLTFLQKEMVLEQVERLIASSEFARSKRMGSFLRFIVAHTLNGVEEPLKERTIGIAVRFTRIFPAIDPFQDL